MTRRQTRLFFIVGTTMSALLFVGMTIHSHTKFGELTNADKLTPQVVAGKHVWHRKNCINCHTLLGEGAYFAPDLRRSRSIAAKPTSARSCRTRRGTTRRSSMAA